MSPDGRQPSSTQMTLAGTLVPLEVRPGPSQEAGGMVVKDLLCGEALSPTANCLRNRVAGSLYQDCNAPRWRAMICPLSPFLNRVRSSLPSKCGEYVSPCYIHQSAVPLDCACDIVATAARSENPGPRLCKAGYDAIVVADLVISRPTLAELGEAMQVLQEREARTSCRLSKRYIDTLLGFGTAGSPLVEVFNVRRGGVFLIFKMVKALRLRKVIAAHAISYLDRFYNNPPLDLVKSRVEGISATQFRYIAAACVSIAAKMDDSAAPSLASLGRISGEDKMSEERLRDMEAIVLQALGWRLLGVTASDFVDNMLAHLPLSGVPSVPVLRAHKRADELIQAILTEVQFLDFEQSIIGLCVMQYILDEIFPLQAVLLMAVLRTYLVVDTLAAEQCYKILVASVVETLPRCSTSSPGDLLQECFDSKHESPSKTNAGNHMHEALGLHIQSVSSAAKR